MTVSGQHAMARKAGPKAGFDMSASPTVRRITVEDEAGLGRLGRHVAEVAVPGDVILLIGDLGAGKTSFARAFIQAHGVDDEIPSPTFSLVQIYETGGDTAPRSIWHFDLYRLEGESDLYELGIEEAFNEGITLIEWPDHLGNLTPPDRLEIGIAFGTGETERRITLTGFGVWARRLDELLGEDDDSV
jgi:tRNA threonylcarbamoyladenosine biosynthesis protein TsaE